MKIVHQWLAELVDVPADVEAVASAIALRGFEVASVDRGVIDFEITANRPDCLNHVGIAREASVIWKKPVRPLTLAPAVESGETIDVDLQDPELCPRYCAQVFEVRIGSSPAWLAERLEAAGVRPINNIVDVTNYVMLEMGQPMHAFDAARLDGGRLVIRRAAAGEPLTTLDGVERRLDADMLVIADARRATAVGGVMGGSTSEIHAGTTNDGPRERLLPARIRAADEQEARTEDRSLDPVRTRRRHPGAARRNRARRRALRENRRRPCDWTGRGPVSLTPSGGDR